jgi:hypothetical protein
LKSFERLSIVVFALVAILLAAPAAASAAVSRDQARDKALDALDVRAGKRPVIVFQLPAALRPGTVVRQAGLSDAKATRARVPRGGRLSKARVAVVKGAVVARAGRERAWLLYEDRAPYQAYQHPGRIVLVGARTGRVTVTKALDWPPLISGRRPVFLRNPQAYRDARYRAFARSWRLRKADKRAASASARASSRESRQRAADELAAERSCAIRVSGTLGSSRLVGPVGRTRTRLSDVFDQLELLNSGFASERYRATGGTSPGGYVGATIARAGCRDVLLYLAGGGYRDGQPAVVVGTRTRGDGSIEQQVVTASDLRAILRANPSVTFKLLLDAPGSGAFLPVLADEPNLLVLAASSAAGEGSFTALRDVVDRRGRPVANRYNPRAELEFSNRQLNGIECFLSSPAEVETAVRAKADGKSRSFLAWMVARGLSLCGDGYLVDSVTDAPDGVLETFGWTVDGGGGSPVAENRAPTAEALGVTTDEDTAARVTLAGTDPDGDPLQFAFAQPSHGTVSGSGADLTYTPNADANGADSFAYTVSDGKGATATGSVSVTVAAVNDAPAIVPNASAVPTTFTEGGPPVEVDPGLELGDVDDDELTAATVAIAGGFVASQDELLFSGQNGIAGTYDGATGVLELTGPASVADYQAALRSVRYDNSSSNPLAAARSVTFRADDGDAQSAVASQVVQLSTVNDAPLLGGGGNVAAYTEDDATGVVVDPAITVSDVDDVELMGATVTIGGSLAAGEDELRFSDQVGISGSYDAASGTLTLTGAAPVADYQDALRSVRYRNTNVDQPSTATRTVSFQVSDGDASAAAAVSSSVTVAAVDDAPALTAGGAAASFTEGDASAVAIDAGLTAADVDDANLESATVSLVGGFEASEDELRFTDQSGIAGSYDDATGVLTLTGSASVADYQAALRSVGYLNGNGDDPSTAQRTVRFQASDGDLDSDPVDAAVAVVAVNDAPVLGGGGNVAAYTEDDATGVVVDPTVTVADVDDAELAGATVTIDANLAADEDELLFSDENGIAGGYDAASGTLTLTGAAPVADYQAALRSVRYRNTDVDQPSTLTRTVSFQVSDGDAAAAAAVSSTVTVAPVNDAPALTAGGATASFTEGDSSAVAVDAGLTADDVDDANLESATVSLLGGFEASEDELRFSDQSGISGTYDDATGVLTLTGSATVADYEAALRSVGYLDGNGDDPSTADRTVRFQASDGDIDSNAIDATVTAVAVNDAPVLGGGGNVAAYTEDDTTGAIVGPGVTVSDVDSANLAGATVQIGANFVASEDELLFTDQNGISGSYDPFDGTLTLTGSASVADYQSALRSVRYRNTEAAQPSTLTRTITFAAGDGALTADAVESTVTVATVDDPPLLTSGPGAPSFTEGGDPTVVDPAIEVSDVDSANLTGATVEIGANLAAGEDELLFADQSDIAGSYDAPTGVLTLTGTASVASYQAALRSVAYRNLDGVSPSTASRQIAFTVVDGSGPSNVATTTLAVVGLNDAPVLSGGADALDYAEGDSATPVDPALTVTDNDDDDLESATASIGDGFDASEDVLEFSDQNGIVGAYDDTTGVLTLTGSATKDEYQAALRAVAYRNSDDVSPSTATRTVAFQASDGEADSNAVATDVTVTRVADAPVLAAGTNSATFVENGTPVVVDDAIAVSDVDSSLLVGATVSIGTGFDAAQGDTLALPVQPPGIFGSYDAPTGVLTLTGAATLAEYRDALRSVVFSNTSEAPTASRTVSFQASDGVATSDAVTHAVAITSVNDAPAVTSGATLDYSENQAATAIDAALGLTDLDGPSVQSATVTIGAGHVAGQDVLSAGTLPGGIAASFNALTGTLTLSNEASVADYRTALRDVRYANSSENPSATPRTVTFRVADSGTPQEIGSATATVTVTPVNDAPSVTGESDSTTGNTRLAYGTSVPSGEAGKRTASGNVLTNDSDVDGPGALVVDTSASSTASAQGGTVAWNADGSFSYVPAAGYTGPDTLTYKVSDQGSPAALGTGTVSVTVANRVWYVDNEATAGGDGRSSQPFDTLAEADAAANATGDRVYVFEGTGTTAGLTGGIALLDNQQLIGEAQDLVVGANTLYDSAPADRPVVQGVVALGSGNTVTGLKVQGSGGPAIQGASGDSGGTLADLELENGTAAGISLVSTSGTWNVSDTTVATSSGDGILATSAGAVDFADSGTIGVSVTNGRGVTISGTQTSGTIDSVTTGASPTTGVSLVDDTGSLTLADLNLTTTGTGLLVQSSNDVTVTASGDATVSSAGRAVDLNTDSASANPANPPDVALTTASSSGGTRGIRLNDIGTGTFSATGGTLQGQSTAAIDVDGGSGNVAYGGTIGNGSGSSATVANRTGGAVTVSGSINDSTDAGGGISLTGNSGGSTTFSGASKTLNTGASAAVAAAFGGGHALDFTNGGLDIDTTTGAGFQATGAAGTVSVQGAGNTIATGSGAALNVNGPDIAASDATFQSIASSGAGTGISVVDSGSAGGLHVTGTPVGSPTAGSGGTIAASTGPGVNLSNTADVQLAALNVTNGQDDGIRGANVNGFTLTNGAQITGNGNAVGERGLDFTGLTGSAAVTGATVSGSAEDNMRVSNDSGTLNALTVTGGTFATNSTTTGNDGIQLESTGTGSLTATIQNATFTNNRGDHVQVVTDGSTTATQNVTIANNDMNADGNQVGFTTLGGGITVNPGGSANTTVSVTGNDVERARDSAIVLNIPAFREGGLPSNATLKATVSGNFVGTSGEADSGSATGDGIYGNFHGNSTATVAILNNDIRRYVNAFGIDLVQNDGDGTMNATVKGNTVMESGSIALSGTRIVVGGDVGDNGTSCLDIGDPSTTALKNRFFGTGVSGAPDIRFRMAGGASGAPSTARLAGYSGGAHDTSAVNSYLAARNDVGGTPVVNSTQFDAFSFYEAAASCPTP